jgi:hypothetical protein
VGTNATTIISGPSGTSAVTVIKALRLGHVGASTDAAVTVDVSLNENDAGDEYLVKNLSIAAGEQVVFAGGAAGSLLMKNEATADVLKATASEASKINATVWSIEKD